MKVVFIGSGNTATVLGRLMRSAGHQIVQVFSRNAPVAAALAGELQAVSPDQLGDLTPDADIYILAVSDDGVEMTARRLDLGEQLVVHTSGSLPGEVLKGVSQNYGVLYPLQSLRKESPYLPQIPFLTDGNCGASKKRILEFAKTLSPMVREAGDAQRSKLHLAAVLGSNFSNHLFALTEFYCAQENIPFNELLPLLRETVDRLAWIPASVAQTGPALRHDQQTMEKHLQLLGQYPALQTLYRDMSDRIQAFSRQ